jgi:hypothetical protein
MNLSKHYDYDSVINYVDTLNLELESLVMHERNYLYLTAINYNTQVFHAVVIRDNGGDFLARFEVMHNAAVSDCLTETVRAVCDLIDAAS